MIAAFRADVTDVPSISLVQAAPPSGVRPKTHTYRYPTPDTEVGAKLDLLFFDCEGNVTLAKLDNLQSFSMNPMAAGRAWWDQDGRRFYLLDGSRDGNHVDVWQIDSLTGEVTRLVTDDTPGAGRERLHDPTIFHLLADGRKIWGSEADGWQHLYVVDAGDPCGFTQLTHGSWRVHELCHVDEDNDLITFVATGRESGQDPYYRQVYSMALDGSGVKLLTPERSNHDVTTPLDRSSIYLRLAAVDYAPRANGFSPNGCWFVDSYSAVDQPSISVLRERNGNIVMVLEQADGSASWPSRMPLPEPFQVQSLDGVTDLWGVLYKPLEFDPAKRYPVIEVIYGGPHIIITPKTFRQALMSPVAEQLAAKGYVVVILDGVGTSHRSREFSFKSYGKTQICGGLPDHVAAIKTLAADRPWMRLDDGAGIIGMSGGGYATFRAMAEFPEFFRVGVAICGNHDQAAYISTWGDSYHGLYDVERYREQANVEVASQIEGQLYLIHGEMDDNVHPAQTLRLVDALISADTDFDLLIVPNAGHEVGFHPYVTRRSQQFFLKHLPVARVDTD